MSNRLAQEFPGSPRQTLPPRTADLRAQARAVRRAVIRRGLRRLVAGLARVPGAALAFVRCGAYGIAKQAPTRAGGCA
jgi:hypothetical protein